MAEAAGLVLGAIPLIFLALEKYQECLEFGSHYKMYTETLTSIKDEVSVQQMLFEDTMETIGLHKPTYVELGNCLQDRLPENHETLMRCIQRMDDTITLLMEKLEVDTTSKSNDISSRVGWEWRRVKRSLSTKKLEELFDQLRKSNAALSKLLSKSEIPSEDQTPMVRRFAARYNQNDCDTVRSQASEVKKALDACWQCSCIHRTSIDLNWHNSRPTRTPVFNISLSLDASNNQGSTGGPQWRKAQVKIDASGVSSSTGNAKQVLGPAITDTILTVPPSQPPGATSKSRSMPYQLLRRSRSTSPLPPLPGITLPIISLANTVKQIDSLCRFVQGLDNGGESLGFLLVPGGTKRVNLKSTAGARVTEEATLMSLLPPSKPPTHLRLSRRKRLEIAVAAAWSTLLLCDTPWLNRTWDKHGLCFFSENVSTAGLPLADRCVSMTQNCSRGSLPATSIGTDLRNKLIRNEAVFALGILLIELGLNQSFEEYKRTRSMGTAATDIIDDYKIADDLIDEVFDEVGEPYGNAVQRCIRFSFSGKDTTKNFSHATFRQEFHNSVVAPIEATLSTMLIW